MYTFKITINDWSNNVLSGSYKGFDPAFDCNVLNFDGSITDLNYELEVATQNQDAIGYFNRQGFKQV